MRPFSVPVDFTSFCEPQGALQGQKILKNGSLFRAGGFYKLLRATGRPPGAKDFEKWIPPGSFLGNWAPDAGGTAGRDPGEPGRAAPSTSPLGS